MCASAAVMAGARGQNRDAELVTRPVVKYPNLAAAFRIQGYGEVPFDPFFLWNMGSMKGLVPKGSPFFRGQ